MMQPLVSILTLYNYDETLFEGMSLPQAVLDDEGQEIAPAIDKAQVIDLIIAECGELNLVWSNPSYLKNLITQWSAAKNLKWQRSYDALATKYNPLENYDRKEDAQSIRTPNLLSEYDNSGDGSSKEFENGYNSGEQVQSSSTENESQTSGSTKQTGTDTNVVTSRIHGNIGVTTSQQMLESELKIANNITIETIVEDFRDHFCVVVY